MPIQLTNHVHVSTLFFVTPLQMLTHEAAIKDTLVEAVKNSMKLAEDAGKALAGDDPNVNELKGWFFAGYRLDTVKGQLSQILHILP
jgi:hypothetical protein